MWFGLTALVVWLADQATKFLAVHFLIEREVVSVVPGLLQFRYATNTGAAFSLFSNHPEILTIAATTIALAILIWNYHVPSHERWIKLSLGLIFGGGIGNLSDRFTRGYVIDFIDVYWRSHHWPTFNIADSATCVGVFVLLTLTLCTHESSKEDSSLPPPANQKPSGNSV